MDSCARNKEASLTSLRRVNAVVACCSPTLGLMCSNSYSYILTNCYCYTKTLMWQTQSHFNRSALWIQMLWQKLILLFCVLFKFESDFNILQKYWCICFSEMLKFEAPQACVVMITTFYMVWIGRMKRICKAMVSHLFYVYFPSKLHFVFLMESM